ncbi:MAG: tetratricopeptide repeat protein [Sphingomonadaceae bacterium]|nr:tetratricopeptide repeat protein [Sphingomonadaceae bacterium]
MVSAPSVRRQRKAERRAEQVRRYGHRRAPIVRLAIWGTVALLILIGAYAIHGFLVDPAERGRAALASGDARSARVDFLNAIAEQPRDATLRIDLARALNNLGRSTDAERQLAKAAELGAQPINLTIESARARLGMGDATGALDALNGPIPAAQAGLANALAGDAAYRNRDFAAAAQYYAGALRLAPNDGDIWTRYARYRLAEQDMLGADNAADRARALAPTSGAAWWVKADVVRYRAGPVASLAWYRAALDHAPNDVGILAEYAAALGEGGRYSAMLDPLSRAAELDAYNPRVLFLEATLAARGGEPALARALLQRIDGDDANQPAILTLRSAVELSLDTPVAAADYAGRLLQLQPDNREARRLYALALATSGNARGAIAAIDMITTASDADSWSLLLLSRAFAANGWQGDADQPALRASLLQTGAAGGIHPIANDQSVGVAPAIMAIRSALGVRDFARARGLADALLAANPGVPQAVLIAGDVAREGGDLAGAQNLYRRAADLRFDRRAMLSLVALQLQMGDRQSAAATLGQYMAHWPEDTAAMRISAGMAAEDGRWQAAKDALLAARDRVGGRDALLLAQLARCDLELGGVGDALASARQAYALMPSNASVSAIYGIALLRNGGNVTDALDLLRKAAQLAPQDRQIAQWWAEAVESAR